MALPVASKRLKMRIEVLFVPGCPNYQPAVERINQVLASESLEAEICGIPVNTNADAKDLHFPGSPTIRINGDDVEPAPPGAPALSCRLYETGGGLPSEEVVRRAVLKAAGKR